LRARTICHLRRKSMRAKVVTLSTLVIACIGVGLQTFAQAPARVDTQVQPQLQLREPLYRIQPGDVFDLDFALTPEFNHTVTVMPDGYISLRGVGPVSIAGQTVAEATNTITKAYAHVLSQPRIAVLLKDFSKPSFFVAGQVEHPGKYDLRGTTTLFQAITVAGGFKDSAKHSQVVLFREAGNNMVSAKLINVKQMLKETDLREDLELHAGDMVYVPQNTLSKIAPYIPRPGVGMYGTIPLP
jgi:polysaccharide biosynthesis/export protein